MAKKIEYCWVTIYLYKGICIDWFWNKALNLLTILVSILLIFSLGKVLKKLLFNKGMLLFELQLASATTIKNILLIISKENKVKGICHPFDLKLFYSPVTMVSNEVKIFKKLFCLMSTVEIFVIPPFLAALLMLASAPK